MKKSFIRLFFISLFLFIFASLNIGSSDFVVNGEVKVDNISINDGDRAVCYIDGSTPTYFTTIERALEVAGAGDKKTTAETIYVIPDNVDKNVTITRNCTVSANDTLILPYQDKLWDFREGKTKLRNRFADDCEAMVEQNKKTVVKIQKGVTLTVNGTLNIGGVLGNAAPDVQGLQGQTSGFYAEILMEVGTDIHAAGGAKKGAKIEVNGTLDCRGYIKETAISDDINIQPQLVLNATAKTSLPFVVYDFQGANATGGIYCGGKDGTIDLGDILVGVFDKNKVLTFNGNACPFVLFDMPNVQILTSIYSGATVTGLVSLHTNKQTVVIDFEESWNYDQFTLIGSTNSLLTIKSKSIDVRYKPAHLGYTEVLRYSENPTRTTIDFNGECTFGSMSMILNAQIAKVKIDTKNILFPFSYRWAFNIRKGGKINVSNGIKLMNGCSLNIDAGGTLNLQNSARITFYNNDWTDYKTTIPYSPTYLIYGTRDNATLHNMTVDNELTVASSESSVSGTTPLINNGTINVNSGAALGGLIQTNSENGKLIFEDGATNTVESLETNGTGGRDGAKYVFKQVNPHTYTKTAQMYVINDFTSLPLIDVSSGTYEGTQLNGFYGFGTRAGTATIIGNDSILPNATKTFEITDNSSHLLGDDFAWSCDDETKLALNSKSGKSITVTGRECGKVNLSCTICYKGKDIKTVTKSIKVGPNPTVTVDTSNIYDNPSDPYNIGGIGDYRDITVTMDKDCNNSRIEWVYDSSKLQLTKTSGSYPTFTYRFTTIAAGNDTLKFNYISDNVTENDCWTQAITIANNKRLTKFEVANPEGLTNKAADLVNFKDCTGTATIVNEVGDLNNSIFFDDSCYTSSNDYLRVESVTLSGNKLTINWQGKGGGGKYGSSYSRKFRVASKNGVNGGVVMSLNELTITVQYKL